MASLTALLSTLWLVVALVSVATADDDSSSEESSESSECSRERGQRKEMPGNECCKFPQPPKEKLDEEKKKNFAQCLKSKGVEKRGLYNMPLANNFKFYRCGLGPPHRSGNGPHPPHHRRHMECFDECFFSISGLLTDNNKLDKEAIKKKAMDIAPDEWSSVTEAALTKCFNTPRSGGNQNSQCKSGAGQLRKCMIREAYMNCPESIWNNGEECQKEKEIMIKCPNRLPPPPGPRNRNQ